jgi:hypothetical protein
MKRKNSDTRGCEFGNGDRWNKSATCMPRRTGPWRIALLLLGALYSLASPAQELSPRAYWPTPVGTNLLVLAFQNTSGDILTDPSLPVSGVKSDLNFMQFGYQRTFDWFSRTGTLQINVPYSWGTTEGFLAGQYRERKTSGMADTQVRFAINLLGAPSMDQEAFRQLLADPQTIVGLSLLLKLPNGDYQPNKYINVGANRWAAKPAIGLIQPIVPGLLFEFEFGVWLYGSNDDFLGQTSRQKPVYAAEAHLVKLTRSGVWASLDVNFYRGGRTSVDRISQANLQSNSRAGVTLFYPWKRRHGLRGSYSTGIYTESGGDFRTLNLSYTYAW